MFEGKFIELDENKWPKKNPYLKDLYNEEIENPVYTLTHEFCIRQVEKQEELIMQTIQNIGGNTHTDITLDKNKILEAFEMYKTMQWTAVKDGLPEKSGFYIVHIGAAEWGHIGIYRYAVPNKKWCGAQVGSVIEGVTHWMPLPNDPKEVW